MCLLGSFEVHLHIYLAVVMVQGVAYVCLFLSPLRNYTTRILWSFVLLPSINNELYHAHVLPDAPPPLQKGANATIFLQHQYFSQLVHLQNPCGTWGLPWPACNYGLSPDIGVERGTGTRDSECNGA